MRYPPYLPVIVAVPQWGPEQELCAHLNGILEFFFAGYLGTFLLLLLLLLLLLFHLLLDFDSLLREDYLACALARRRGGSFGNNEEAPVGDHEREGEHDAGGQHPQGKVTDHNDQA